MPDLHAARRQHPPHLAAQAEPHLVGEHHAGAARHAGLPERGRHPPSLQASCAAGSACSAIGRGTFGRTPSRRNVVGKPPGR